MGIFSRGTQEASDGIPAMVHPPNGRARKHVSRIAEDIREVLSEGEEVNLISVDFNKWGVPVTVITNKQVIRFHQDGLEDQTPLSGLTDPALVPEPGGTVRVTAKPGLNVIFPSLQEAAAFAAPLEPRDIPSLYPVFFERVLRANGLPVTPTNMSRLADRVARSITMGGAFSFFKQAGDMAARQRFEHRYWRDSTPNPAPTICDDMIDWLWQWQWLCHEALRRQVARIEEFLTSEQSPLRKYKDEIAPSEWGPFG